MDQDLHQNQNNQKPQTIGGVTFSAGLSHPVTPQVSPGSNQPSFAKPASEQSNIATPQPTIPSPADLFNNNSAAFSAPQSTPATTPVTENPANAYQSNNYTSPAASAEQIFAAENTNCATVGLHILYHFITTRILEVNIDIRHRNTLFV